jgi:hypothetical protein
VKFNILNNVENAADSVRGHFAEPNRSKRATSETVSAIGSVDAKVDFRRAHLAQQRCGEVGPSRRTNVSKDSRSVVRAGLMLNMANPSSIYLRVE